MPEWSIRHTPHNKNICFASKQGRCEWLFLGFVCVGERDTSFHVAPTSKCSLCGKHLSCLFTHGFLACILYPVLFWTVTSQLGPQTVHLFQQCCCKDHLSELVRITPWAELALCWRTRRSDVMVSVRATSYASLGTTALVSNLAAPSMHKIINRQNVTTVWFTLLPGCFWRLACWASSAS